MAESEGTKEEQVLETIVESSFGVFAYKAERLVLRQTFEQPLEFDAVQIWNSPLGRELASLTVSQLCAPFSSGGKLVPKEAVASVAKEMAQELGVILSKPIEIDALFAGLPEDWQAYSKENWGKAQEAGLTLERSFGSFRAFLVNIASEAPAPASDIPCLSSQERMLILLYLMQGWHLASMLVMVASCGDEDRSRLQSFQRPEYEAVVEYVMEHYGWHGDRNKAIELVRDSLGPELDSERRRKGWRIPGARYGGIESWIEPRNDERQEMTVGLHEGLEWAAKQGLVHILPDVRTGKLRNSLKMAAIHNLIDAIRKTNRRLGIEVPPEWSAEGKTEDEVREQVEKGLTALTPKELLDFEIERDEDSTTILESASDRESFKLWTEEESEQDRKALLAEKLLPLLHKTHLTPRLRLVAKLFDKNDSVIAARLEEAFGKPVKPGAVRAMRHDLLVKLRNVAAGK